MTDQPKIFNYFRLLPQFIIIGAQKAGTTSLYTYLTQHPNVRPAHQKEVHFFDLNFTQGLNWYRSNFSTRFRQISETLKGKPFITGESSPYYLLHPLVPQRVAKVLPQVKLIVLLRNPVDRAYSHYHHNRKMGRESLSFADAIAAEPERLAGEREKILSDSTYNSFNYQHYSYLTRGFYLEQLQVWLEYFPRSQFLILHSESLSQQPSEIFLKTLEFLNLSAWEPAAYYPYYRNEYDPIDAKIREQLNEYFQEANQKLSEFLQQSWGINSLFSG